MSSSGTESGERRLVFHQTLGFPAQVSTERVLEEVRSHLPTSKV
jgi:hypothetical protein